MRVACLGMSQTGVLLARGMNRAGHQVNFVAGLPEEGYDAIILAVDRQKLPRAVAAVEPHVRRGQIVIHTCLTEGVQVLDDLEVHGAVVVAMSPVSLKRWAVTTVDELGSTIAELILGEMGAVAVPKTDAERAPLAVYLAHTLMLDFLARAAVENVQDMIHAPVEEDRGLEEPFWAPVDPNTVMDVVDTIHDPGLLRYFVDTARRYAELTGDAELEMWVMQREQP